MLSNDGQYLHCNLRASRRLVCRILSGSTGSQRSWPLETGGPNELGGCDRADLPGPPGRLVSRPSRRCGAGYGSGRVKMKGSAAASPAPRVPPGIRIGLLLSAVHRTCLQSVPAPGSRGQLPTRGSHRSGRAPFEHPAPRAMDSLRNGTHCARPALAVRGRSCAACRIAPTSSARAASPAMEKTRPSRFLGDPCTHAPLSDPGGAPAPGPFGTGVGVFRSTDSVDPARIYFRGSITRPARSLCTLRSRGHPRTTQHSVPAGGQPWPVRSLTCWVASKVSAMCIPLHAFPLHQASPGATVAKNPAHTCVRYTKYAVFPPKQHVAQVHYQ